MVTQPITRDMIKASMWKAVWICTPSETGWKETASDNWKPCNCTDRKSSSGAEIFSSVALIINLWGGNQVCTTCLSRKGNANVSVRLGSWGNDVLNGIVSIFVAMFWCTSSNCEQWFAFLLLLFWKILQTVRTGSQRQAIGIEVNCVSG